MKIYDYGQIIVRSLLLLLLIILQVLQETMDKSSLTEKLTAEGQQILYGEFFSWKEFF